MTKTLLMTSSEISISRYILRTDFLKHLLSFNIRLILVVPEREKQNYEKEFGGPKVIVEELPRIASTPVSRLISFLARNCHPSRTILWVQKEQYFMDGSLVSFAVRIAVRTLFGFLPLTPRIIRFFELKLREDPAIVSLFDKYCPDAVWATMLFRENDILISRGAKRRKITLIGMVRSWDNFTTYGYTGVLPDAFLAQSEFIAKMAQKYQKFPSNMIKVVGTPLYDFYIRKDIIWPREKFLSYFGFPLNAKVALYGAMGTFLFTKEGDLISVFKELLKQKFVPSSLWFLFRAHPSFPIQEELPNAEGRITIHHTDKGGSAARGEMTTEDEELYVNSLFHADLVVSATSTVAVEAALFDKPVISIVFDPARPPARVRSAKGFHFYFTHFREMLLCGGIRIAHSPEKLGEAISEYLSDPTKDSAGRRCIRQLLLEPLDGRSAERLANAVAEVLKASP